MDNRLVTSTRRSPGRWISPILGILIFIAALTVLRRELATVSFAEVRDALTTLTRNRIALAVLFTTLHYLILTGYEQLAFLHLRKELVRWRVIAASWLGYAISNSVGVPVLSGTTVRYRFYARWGITTGDFARLVVFYSSAFVLGMVVIAGWGLVFLPLDQIGGVMQVPLRAVGIVLLLFAPGYVMFCALRSSPIQVGGFRMTLPSPRLAISHLVVSAADWIVGATIVYVLLSDGSLPFMLVMGAFVSAQLLGLVSNVPGGLGIFEGTMLLTLGTRISHAELISALLVYRIIYYLLPLMLALTVLALDELWMRRGEVVRFGQSLQALLHRTVYGRARAKLHITEPLASKSTGSRELVGVGEIGRRTRRFRSKFRRTRVPLRTGMRFRIARRNRLRHAQRHSPHQSNADAV